MIYEEGDCKERAFIELFESGWDMEEHDYLYMEHVDAGVER
jgi:hypothetical protein